ncbi:hypothetical protein SDC9_138067 [bioreactor metagenome]|uniref:Uncharacterized protein n=1 Tax=bioreactor metagenome TaxID=1076179 RepID=A0A645DNA3_9ZZZZ
MNLGGLHQLQRFVQNGFQAVFIPAVLIGQNRHKAGPQAQIVVFPDKRRLLGLVQKGDGPLIVHPLLNQGVGGEHFAVAVDHPVQLPVLKILFR